MTAAAIEGEHYAGVETGGMDQSISVMAPEGSALLIDFYPSLAATAIKLPKVTPAPVFVISNTLVVSEKALTAPTNYNLRVVETRLAAALLRKKLCNESTKKVIHLRQVQDMFGAEGDSSITKLGLMIEMVEQSFDKSPYTLEQIAKELEQTPQEVSTTFIGAIVIRADGFALYSRAMHVLTEARRVLQFQKVSSEDSPDVLKKMGELMNQSHESCRDLFQCSCPELDELRSIALESGALGCRLTGAGWGGCAVSLVPENKVKGFMGALTESYYYKHFPELKENPEQLRDALFASYPAIGAAVLNMDSK